MKGKIALEEHVSTQENNRLWDSKSEALRNGRNYMDNVEKRLLETELRLRIWMLVASVMLFCH